MYKALLAAAALAVLLVSPTALAQQPGLQNFNPFVWINQLLDSISSISLQAPAGRLGSEPTHPPGSPGAMGTDNDGNKLCGSYGALYDGKTGELTQLNCASSSPNTCPQGKLCLGCKCLEPDSDEQCKNAGGQCTACKPGEKTTKIGECSATGFLGLAGSPDCVKCSKPSQPKTQPPATPTPPQQPPTTPKPPVPKSCSFGDDGLVKDRVATGKNLAGICATLGNCDQGEQCVVKAAEGKESCVCVKDGQTVYVQPEPEIPSVGDGTITPEDEAVAVGGSVPTGETTFIPTEDEGFVGIAAPAGRFASGRQAQGQNIQIDTGIRAPTFTPGYGLGYLDPVRAVTKLFGG